MRRECGPSRWMDIQMVNKQPMKAHLSGLDLEYRVLQLYAKEAGKREAKLAFDVGQGSQDLGFRNEVDILFTIKPSAKVTLRVLDLDDKPTTGSFLIRDDRQRVLPVPDQASRAGLLLSSAGLPRGWRIGRAAAGQIHDRVLTRSRSTAKAIADH